MTAAEQIAAKSLLERARFVLETLGYGKDLAWSEYCRFCSAHARPKHEPDCVAATLLADLEALKEGGVF